MAAPERAEINNLQAGVDLVFCLTLFTSAFFSLALSVFSLSISPCLFFCLSPTMSQCLFFQSVFLLVFVFVVCLSVFFPPGPVFLCLSFLLSLTFCLFHLSFIPSLSVFFLLSVSVFVSSVSLSIFLFFFLFHPLCLSSSVSLFFRFLFIFLSFLLPACLCLSLYLPLGLPPPSFLPPPPSFL